jgi:hypothetical protein
MMCLLEEKVSVRFGLLAPLTSLLLLWHTAQASPQLAADAIFYAPDHRVGNYVQHDNSADWRENLRDLSFKHTKVFLSTDAEQALAQLVQKPRRSVMAPNLTVQSVDQWHRLLNNTSATLVVGNVEQSFLETCSASAKHPRMLYVHGASQWTSQLLACFPDTKIYLEETSAITAGMPALSKMHPNFLRVPGDLDAASAEYLKDFKGRVNITGDSFPPWLEAVVGDAQWVNLTLEDVTELTVEQAEVLSRSQSPKLILPELDTLPVAVAKILGGSPDKSWVSLQVPKLREIKPEALSHITRYITHLFIGVQVWDHHLTKAIKTGKKGTVKMEGVQSVSEKALVALLKQTKWTPDGMDFESGRKIFFGSIEALGPKEYDLLQLSDLYGAKIYMDSGVYGSPKVLSAELFEHIYKKDQRLDQENDQLTDADTSPEPYEHIKHQFLRDLLGAVEEVPLSVLKQLSRPEFEDVIFDVIFCSPGSPNGCISLGLEKITSAHAEYMVSKYSRVQLHSVTKIDTESLQILAGLSDGMWLGLTSLSVEQAKILGSSSMQHIRLPRLVEIPQDALRELVKFKGKLKLPDWLQHEFDAQPYLIQSGQIAPEKIYRWHPRSLEAVGELSVEEVTVRVDHDLSEKQISALAQFKGQRLNISVPRPTAELNQILAASSIPSIGLYFVDNDESVSFRDFIAYKGGLDILVGEGIESYFVPSAKDELTSIRSAQVNELIAGFSGESLSVGTLHTLDKEIAGLVVSTKYQLSLSVFFVDARAVRLIMAHPEREVYISTTWTSDFCFSHVENPHCHTDLWDDYSEP